MISSRETFHHVSEKINEEELQIKIAEELRNPPQGFFFGGVKRVAIPFILAGLMVFGGDREAYGEEVAHASQESKSIEKGMKEKARIFGIFQKLMENLGIQPMEDVISAKKEVIEIDQSTEWQMLRSEPLYADEEQNVEIQSWQREKGSESDLLIRVVVIRGEKEHLVGYAWGRKPDPRDEFGQPTCEKVFVDPEYLATRTPSHSFVEIQNVGRTWNYANAFLARFILEATGDGYRTFGGF